MSRRVKRKTSRRTTTERVTSSLLKRWALPDPPPDSDKDDRGSVLVAGGSAQVPGALILSGIAALRAGAGKLQLAAPRSVARTLGALVMEAGVFPLPESRDGALGREAGRKLRARHEDAAAVLIGPGMMSPERAAGFTAAFRPRKSDCPVVIDAACIPGLSLSSPLGPHVVLTPHAGEMAALLGVSKKLVCASPEKFAGEVAAALDAIVVLKGARTIIASGRKLFRYEDGQVGLATSGSGDVLSGIIAGLLARGAGSDQAAVWGVAIHGAAGRRAGRRIGPISFLARDLLTEIPEAMAALAR